MRCIISRTSGIAEDGPPVEGAVKSVEDGDVNWFADIIDIFEFAKKHGECIVSVDYFGRPRVEIYDTYRE